jgi:DNA-directed RNA polymerase specialized sigma24 family protein
MSSPSSVTEWIARLKAGDPAAAARLWQRYFRRMTEAARERLRGAPPRGADEEDAALSAFDSFCRGAFRGRFPDVEDRHDLWALLATITARKAIDLYQHDRRVKRGGGAARGDAGPHGPADVESAEGREPPPDFAAQVKEEFRRRLDALGSAELEQIALWKLEGDGNEEIAARLGCALRTVERKLRRIRDLWAEEMQP